MVEYPGLPEFPPEQPRFDLVEPPLTRIPAAESPDATKGIPGELKFILIMAALLIFAFLGMMSIIAVAGLLSN